MASNQTDTAAKEQVSDAYIPVTCEELACIAGGLTSLGSVSHVRVRVLGKARAHSNPVKRKRSLTPTEELSFNIYLSSVGEPVETVVKLDLR